MFENYYIKVKRCKGRERKWRETVGGRGREAPAKNLKETRRADPH